MNVWSLGVFVVSLLLSLCFWNCMQISNPKKEENWYGCLDQNGKPADFFTLYKLPHDENSNIPNIKDGTAYMYLLPDSSSSLFLSGGVSSVFSYSDSSSYWVLSDVSISDSSSMPGRTLSDLYRDKYFRNNAAYFFYNDEFPNGTVSLGRGHSKGVLVLSPLGGYWLIHSVPKYPPPPGEAYSYPHTAHRYGQSALCISLPPIDTNLVNNLAGQLIQNDVFVYASNIPYELKKLYPVLGEITDSKKHDSVPVTRIRDIISTEGKIFTSFAKNKDFGDDLYAGLIAPTLKTNLLVESWRNGKDPLMPTCNTSYFVENVMTVNARVASIKFTVHRDHSKWAVSDNIDKPFVCVGDINRMRTQYVRGGGSVCISSLSVWYRFKDLIEESDHCPRNN